MYTVFMLVLRYLRHRQVKILFQELPILDLNLSIDYIISLNICYAS